MKLLIKKIIKANISIILRNLLKYKPVHMSVDGIQHASVSDAFAWRTDNNFRTIFKYSDILNVFYKIKNSWVEFYFYNKNNQLLKIEKKENLNLSNEIEITPDFFGGLKDYGTFYIYHFSKDKIETENIISNRCYLGYSKDQGLPSFVHGNTFAKFNDISNNKIEFSDIKTSFHLVLTLGDSLNPLNYYHDSDFSKMNAGKKSFNFVWSSPVFKLEKDKTDVLKEHNYKRELPFYISWLLIIVKFFYYNLQIFHQNYFLHHPSFFLLRYWEKE